MYGYEITQQVKERTNGEITLTYGALYPVLHKLEEEGCLITESEEADGRLRKYYSLTAAGTRTAQVKVSEFERFMEAMKSLMEPGYDKPGLSQPGTVQPESAMVTRKH